MSTDPSTTNQPQPSTPTETPQPPLNAPASTPQPSAPQIPTPVEKPIVISLQIPGGAKTIFLGVAGIIVLIVAISLVLRVFSPSQPSVPMTVGKAPSLAQKIIKTDLTKYKTDTDTDGYPDFIETAVGLDPRTSEYDTCKKNGCEDANLTKTTVNRNVIIILDASGSMGTGQPSRMDIAKQAIKNYINRSEASTKIGLMVYGHKGSNATKDKAASCASTEMMSPIGQFTSQSVDSVLTRVKATGWTPMGTAIAQAAKQFASTPTADNEIILLSDGAETCDSNPASQATTAKNMGYNIKINVIGFAVDVAAQSQLNQISTSGGGTFSVASNLTDLDREFSDIAANSVKKYVAQKCKIDQVTEFRSCYNAAFNKVIDWVSKQKLLLYDKKITQNEYDELQTLGSALYKQQSTITANETKNAIK